MFSGPHPFFSAQDFFCHSYFPHYLQQLDFYIHRFLRFKLSSLSLPSSILLIRRHTWFLIISINSSSPSECLSQLEINFDSKIMWWMFLYPLAHKTLKEWRPHSILLPIIFFILSTVMAHFRYSFNIVKSMCEWMKKHIKIGDSLYLLW